MLRVCVCVRDKVVTKLCVCDKARAEQEEGGRGRDTDQKQEPHKKMWGIKHQM